MNSIGDDGTNTDRPGGAVAAGHQETVRTAQLILEAGGNAFDAAVAGALTACVAEPVLASLGGGGFALARTAAGKAEVFDFFAQTPRRRRDPAEVSFFEIDADFGQTTQAFHIGLGAAATPGFVPGLFELWRRHGSMPMASIAEPAIEAARRGVPVNPFQSYLFGVVCPIYTHDPASLACFGGGAASGLVGDGDILSNPDLADAIELLADEGERAVRDGDLAQGMAECSRTHGGHLCAEDLLAYQVEIRDPLCFEFRGHRIATNPLPSTGGLLIGFGLSVLERAGIAATGPVRWSDWVSIMALSLEARRDIRSGAASGVASDLLDPLRLDEFARRLAGHPPSYRGTTHISVVDDRGNAAAVTLSNGEGCGVMVPGCGFMLNNMLGEEDINPHGPGNWPEDTRMSSMMAPTMIDGRDGQITVLGSGGSNRIRTAMMQVIEHLTRPDSDLGAAVAAPRLHLEDDSLFYEASRAWGADAFDSQSIAALSGVEHVQRFNQRSMFFGGVHAVRVASDGRQFDACGDARRAGCAVMVHRS